MGPIPRANFNGDGFAHSIALEDFVGRAPRCLDLAGLLQILDDVAWEQGDNVLERGEVGLCLGLGLGVEEQGEDKDSEVREIGHVHGMEWGESRNLAQQLKQLLTRNHSDVRIFFPLRRLFVKCEYKHLQIILDTLQHQIHAC